MRRFRVGEQVTVPVHMIRWVLLRHTIQRAALFTNRGWVTCLEQRGCSGERVRASLSRVIEHQTEQPPNLNAVSRQNAPAWNDRTGVHFLSPMIYLLGAGRDDAGLEHGAGAVSRRYEQYANANGTGLSEQVRAWNGCFAGI